MDTFLQVVFQLAWITFVVACETFATTGTIVVAGEIRTQSYVDVQEIVRNTLRNIGYDRAKYWF